MADLTQTQEQQNVKQESFVQTKKDLRGMIMNQKNSITVLLLLLFWPAGLILMWVWVKWNIKIKILITFLTVGLLFIAGFIVITLATSTAVNPTRALDRVAQANARVKVAKMCQAYLSCIDSEANNWATKKIDYARCDSFTKIGYDDIVSGAMSDAKNGTYGFYRIKNGVASLCQNVKNIGSQESPCTPGWQDKSIQACIIYCDVNTGLTQTDPSCLIK